MKIIKRSKLRRGGFAGLRETRMVMSPMIFRGQQESGTSAGIGRLVYLADAAFLPHGDTRMHTHQEVDVISIMVKGRIHHEGSLANDQELLEDSVQVQRAGGEGFSHNEINPDATKNRMIQLWAIPEVPDQAAGYKVYQTQPNTRTRVYGGSEDQDDTFAARTVVDVAHVAAGETLEQPGRCLAYVTTGSGTADKEVLREGTLVESKGLIFKAAQDSRLILAYEI